MTATAPRETDRSGSVHSNDMAALTLYLREIQRIPVLSTPDEQALGVRAQGGDRAAIDELVRHNLRFVVMVARRYARHGVPLEDLIDEGNLGLIRAAERFDPNRGFRFVSYAVWWIRQSILQHLSDKSRIVRLPVSKVQQLSRLSQANDRLAQSLGRDPTVAEIGFSLSLPPEKVEWLRTLPTMSFSIDEPGEGGESEFEMDTLVDARAGNIEDDVAVKIRDENLDRCVDQLDPRIADVVRRYYGLGGTMPESLESIGKAYGVTRERVRQLRDRGIEKLRLAAECVALGES